VPPVDASLTHSVLVVDDDISLRPMLAAWVNKFGFCAYEAPSAEDALAQLEHTPVDIALCDVNMPGRNGVWLAARIREQHPTTAVIMSTSVDDAEVAVATLSNDVVDYLLKPFDSSRLREALSLGLDWHRERVGDKELHSALQSRLRTRRANVAFCGFAAQNRAVFRIVFGHAAAYHDVIRRAQDLFAEEIEENIREGVAQGAFAPLPTDVAAQAMVGMATQILSWWTEHESMPIETLQDTMTTIALQGLRAPAPAPTKGV